jgi:RsiW-degrading membrane proteinase PrsW (M82 family)
LTAGGLVAVAIIGPVTEEVTKIALALWVAERRPYLFKAIWQILLAAAAGGFLFGFIENLLYLYVYIPDHSQALADFRWSACMGLHVNCSFIAGVGVARMWNHTMQSRVRPDISMALPWIGIAVAGHGLYNLTVTLLELGGVLNLE